MENPVTVFRSADSTAEEDAAEVMQMLGRDGIEATVVDDSAPGVPSGAWEVRVDAKDSAQAEALIAAHPLEALDESHALDLVTVFRSASSNSEVMSVKALLESNGLDAFLIGDSRYPTLPQEVRVAREHVTQAKRLMADALEAGPAAAAEAERETES